MPVWRGFWTALIGLVCLCLAGCQVVPQAQGSIPVGLAAVEEPAAIQVKGRLVPRNFVTLTAAQGSRIEQVMALEGQRVTAGDVLVQFEGHESSASEIAAAQLELILADQQIEALYREAGLKLARVELELAEAAREQAFAQDHYESLAAPVPKQDIDQAYANLLLAEKQKEKARHDLEKAQKRFDNKNSIIWLFIDQRKFKLQITLLESQLADRQRRYQDAQDKYQDLLEWPDEIDLALAESRLEQANADLQQLQEKRDKLHNGPDADDLQLAQSRRKAAESRLAAAQAVLASTELRAPMDGIVAESYAKPGEWLPGGQPAVVLADLRQWVVETEDLGEKLVPNLLPGQSVMLSVDAIPDLSVRGRVEKIDLLYTEDDEEIYYTADITPSENDPRLRWGMTVRVEFDQPDSSG
jgi:HlyD family secretion protein